MTRALLASIPLILLAFWLLWQTEPEAPRKAPEAPPQVTRPPRAQDLAATASEVTKADAGPRVPGGFPGFPRLARSKERAHNPRREMKHALKEAGVERETRHAIGELQRELRRRNNAILQQVQKGEISAEQGEQLLDVAISDIDQQVAGLLGPAYPSVQETFEAARSEWRADAVRRLHERAPDAGPE